MRSLLDAANYRAESLEYEYKENIANSYDDII